MADSNWYDPILELGSGAWEWLTDDGNAEEVGAFLGATGTALDWFENDQKRAGYQGKIPEYTAVREQLPVFDPNRRPGGGGQRYFTDTYYGQTPEDQQTVGSLANAQAAADAQKVALVAQNPEQFARGGIVGALNGMYGRGTGGGSGYGNSNGVGQQLSGSADDIGSPPRRNPYGNVDNWDASAWQNMVSQVQAATPPQGPIITQGGPPDDPRFQPGGAWYQPPKPKFDTNSAAFKEALTKKMYEDAIAKSGISVEELYKAAGIPNPHAPAPDVFTGGSQYFDESTGQYTGGPNAPKSMPDTFTGGSQTFDERVGMAQGGIVNAMPRAYLNGSSDGMGDQVPAMIDNQRPASLSHGEMVIPADVVSHMGNGNSDAGAQQFYDMMDRVRKARTGNKQQGKQINPNKFIPR